MGGAIQLILVGVLFHTIYIFSIFDIYFTSPLVHGMAPYKLEPQTTQSSNKDEHRAPARRLILLVGDGLRADTLFDDQGAKTAPHLRELINTRASYGISHTRVPTESRPGHVAIIAGFYEDPSAVTKGWKLNPINFDSVFNQTKKTLSFGSPDILPMFQLGASDPTRVNASMYTAEDENFAKDPRWLDNWSFDQFENVLEQAKDNEEIDKMLRTNELVIFLHLLGLDTAGHAFWPGKPEYREALSNLDKRLKLLEDKLANFYNHDNQTAFIFTADHGMGNQGSHGDGHPDNTRTPLVAWGAGITGPEKSQLKGHDSFSENWSISQYTRKDVAQADIAPLMASLIGTNYPMNSVGVLPIDYLDAPESYKAASALVNARQVMAQYIVKAELKRNTELFFKPYPTFGKIPPNVQLENIEKLVLQEKYSEAEKKSIDLIKVTLEGLRYLQTYDWLLLRSIVSLGYLGWVFYCMCYLIASFQGEENAIIGASFLVHTVTLGPGVILAIVLAMQSSPWKYFLYLSFPVLFWNQILARSSYFIPVVAQTWKSGNTFKSFGALIITIIALEFLVFSYFHREVLGFGSLLIAAWPWLEAPEHLRLSRSTLFSQWTMACLCTAIFPFLPVEKKESLTIIAIGGLLVISVGLAAIYYAPLLTPSELSASPNPQVRAQEITRIKQSVGTQVLLVLISILQMLHSGSCLQARLEVPAITHYIGWMVIVGSIGYLTLSAKYSDHYLHRLLSIFLGFAPVYIILSISYEVLFYVNYFIILATWLQIEQALYENSGLVKFAKSKDNQTLRPMSLVDMRSAILFLFYLNLAFFGTGNIASVSSFSLQAVLRLTVKFDAFIMGGLLSFKILTPFFVLAGHFALAGSMVDLQPLAPFLLVLAVTDIMTLNFFFMVRDEGSWLEIGTSISHFAIGSLFSLFASLLYLFAHWLTRKAVLRRPIRANLRQD